MVEPWNHFSLGGSPHRCQEFLWNTHRSGRCHDHSVALVNFFVARGDSNDPEKTGDTGSGGSGGGMSVPVDATLPDGTPFEPNMAALLA